jgi:hypothetical protein
MNMWNFVDFVKGILFGRYEYVKICNVAMMQTEFLPLSSSF